MSWFDDGRSEHDHDYETSRRLLSTRVGLTMAAKRSAARRPASAVPVALERLAKLSGAGTPPDRMTRETGKIIAEWRADPEVAMDELAERLDTLRENLAAGVADAQEQAGDVDQGDKAATRQAAATLAGLKAALAATVG